MKTYQLRGILTALFILLLILFAPQKETKAERASPALAGPLKSRDKNLAGGWISMPAGARSAYIGIHGGTMPVSLLASRDGQALVAFVGQTGNDFLYILRRLDNAGRSAGDIYPNQDNAAIIGPSALAHEPSRHILLLKPGNNATILKAATSIGSVPVIYASGQSFSKLDISAHDWLPFGLSEKRLLMEGQVGKPLTLPGKTTKSAKQLARWRFGGTSLY